MINSRRRLRLSLRQEEGIALVEFALLLPLFLILLLGMLDVGKALSYWLDETHLANEVARYAAVNKSPVPGQSIEAAVKDTASTDELKQGGGSISGSGAAVCVSFPSGSTGAVGDPVQVKVTANYHWLDYLKNVLGPLGLPATQTLTATTTMRIERAYDNVTPSNNAYTKQTSC